jgi:hypothetical protein
MGGRARSGSTAPQTEGRAECNFGDIEIPSRNWVLFLDSFSRQHEGWLASILETHGQEKIVGVVDSKLQGITLSRPDEKWRLHISLLRSDGKPVVHSVPDPLRLIFKRDASGAHQGLEITSGDGRVTVLRFRAAARPETLDGVLPGFAVPAEEQQ